VGQRLKAVLRTYTKRTTPWGAPWWVYVVTIGAANVIRQLVMPDDVSTATQIGTFVGMLIVVATLVTVVYLGLVRRDRERMH
jgi:hypothetical protein